MWGAGHVPSALQGEPTLSFLKRNCMNHSRQGDCESRRNLQWMVVLGRGEQPKKLRITTNKSNNKYSLLRERILGLQLRKNKLFKEKLQGHLGGLVS